MCDSDHFVLPYEPSSRIRSVENVKILVSNSTPHNFLFSSCVVLQVFQPLTCKMYTDKCQTFSNSVLLYKQKSIISSIK